MAGAALTATIVEIHATSGRSYGAPRVHTELLLGLGCVADGGVAGILRIRETGLLGSMDRVAPSEAWYNPRRRHISIADPSRAEFEHLHRTAATAA